MPNFFILVRQFDGKTAGLIETWTKTVVGGAVISYDFARYERNRATTFPTEEDAGFMMRSANVAIDARHPECVGRYTMEVLPISRLWEGASSMRDPAFN